MYVNAQDVAEFAHLVQLFSTQTPSRSSAASGPQQRQLVACHSGSPQPSLAPDAAALPCPPFVLGKGTQQNTLNFSANIVLRQGLLLPDVPLSASVQNAFATCAQKLPDFPRCTPKVLFSPSECTSSGIQTAEGKVSVFQNNSLKNVESTSPQDYRNRNPSANTTSNIQRVSLKLWFYSPNIALLRAEHTGSL